MVEPGARIGADTRVWHHSHVRDGASVGAGCTIGKNAFVDAGVEIGDLCKIQNNACLYAGTRLADEVFVGPGAIFTNDRHPRAQSPGWRPGTTTVERGASVGASATVVSGVVIGEWAMVAAGAVVVRDIEPYELVGGVPARRLGWVCRCGHVVDRTDGPRPRTACTQCGRQPDSAEA